MSEDACQEDCCSAPAVTMVAGAARLDAGDEDSR
jgi:hypothetical protein